MGRGLYLQVVGGFDHHTGHQVGVSPQLVHTLLRGGAEHFHAVSRGAQQQPAATRTRLRFYTSLKFTGETTIMALLIFVLIC